MPFCLDRGIGILPWSPLGGGWLTGKYYRTAPTGATRLGENPKRGLENYQGRANERTWAILDAVQIGRASWRGRGEISGGVVLGRVLSRPRPHGGHPTR